MTYTQALQMYFERSNSLQWYWTVYVVVIGGLLAFSSMRQQPDKRTALLVVLLYCFFAYKNLGGIRDVTFQRYGVLDTLKAFPTSTMTPMEVKARATIEPTLLPPAFAGVRNFHVASDVLTVLAVLAMERRRMRTKSLVSQPV